MSVTALGRYYLRVIAFLGGTGLFTPITAAPGVPKPVEGQQQRPKNHDTVDEKNEGTGHDMNHER